MSGGWVEADPSMFDAVDPEFGDRYLMVEEGTVACSECRKVIGPHLVPDLETDADRMTWTSFWFHVDRPDYRICEDCLETQEDGW